MQQSRQKIFDENNIDLQKQITLRNLFFKATQLLKVASLS